MRNVVLRQHLVQYRILGNAALLTVCLLEIREDLQQPENALATPTADELLRRRAAQNRRGK